MKTDRNCQSNLALGAKLKEHTRESQRKNERKKTKVGLDDW